MIGHAEPVRSLDETPRNLEIRRSWVAFAHSLELGAPLAVTNDKQWKRVKGILVACLADYDS